MSQHEFSKLALSTGSPQHNPCNTHSRVAARLALHCTRGPTRAVSPDSWSVLARRSARRGSEGCGACMRSRKQCLGWSRRSLIWTCRCLLSLQPHARRRRFPRSEPNCAHSTRMGIRIRAACTRAVPMTPHESVAFLMGTLLDVRFTCADNAEVWTRLGTLNGASRCCNRWSSSTAFVLLSSWPVRSLSAEVLTNETIAHSRAPHASGWMCIVVG
eukprot:1179640-Rhodomonas_salina.1